MSARIKLGLLAALAASMMASSVAAQPPGAAAAAGVSQDERSGVTGASPLASARVDERLGASLPLDVPLRDQGGRVVLLGDVLDGNPTLLLFGYFHCEMLCGLVFSGAAEALSALERDGLEVPPYRVISLSIDPRDGPEAARARRAALISSLGWSDARWPFLTGEDGAARAVAAAVGFQYQYDPSTLQYAHPAVITVVSPKGRVSSYLYGIDFDARDIARALEDARDERTRSPIARVLLRCFHYVPALRQYADDIARYFHLGGFVIVAAMLAGFLYLRRIEVRRGRQT
jgi:protein SCO1/2